MKSSVRPLPYPTAPSATPLTHDSQYFKYCNQLALFIGRVMRTEKYLSSLTD